MMKTSGQFKRLWGYILPRRRKQLVLLCGFMVLASVAEVASIGSVLPFLGVLMAPEQGLTGSFSSTFLQVLHIENSHLLFSLTMVFILVALISAGMRVALMWAQTRFSYAIGADFSIQIYKNTLYQPYDIHLSRNSSDVIAGISMKANSVVGGAVLPLLTIVSAGMIFVAILLTLIVIDPVVAVAALVGLGVPYVAIVLITKKFLIRNGQRINSESNLVIKALQEGLGGIRDVLLDGTQATYCEIYKRADMSLRRAQANVQIISGAPRFLIEFLGMTLIAILAYFLAGQDAGIASEVPVLGALALGAQRLLPILQQLYNSWASVRGSQASLQDVLAYMDQPLPAHLEGPSLSPIPFQVSIRLNHIGYSYPKTLPNVLHDINLEIFKGSRIGFIGSTGSGKSTLLDIIMGLLTPTQGAISVDGKKITQQNSRAWQSRIAHVPQAIFLADTSISENIAFGVPAMLIDRERVKQAASQAQLASAIESWDGGYDTLVGERGIRLSGGQRQRIGIARALYKQADLMVFDEATSALDNGTENAVMNAINCIGKHITVLLVAHRLTTLQNCDRIIELENGRIKRVGTYNEIIHFKS